MMYSLPPRISALADEEAITLLRRLARALATTAVDPAKVRQQAQSFAEELSLTAERMAPTSPGDTARTALLLLAGDPRYAPAIANLLDAPRGSFGRDTTPISDAELLTVLQTQLPKSGNAGSAEPSTGAAQQPGLMRALTRQLLGSLGMLPSHMNADVEYRVWYATSRKPIDLADPSQGYGAERDTCIHYGSCQVFIPRSHQVGSTGSGWWKRMALGVDDRLRLLATEAHDPKAFWQALRQQLAAVAHDDRDALVFLHGFNVSFEQAALRAAQIGFDLQVRGAMALYSWASRGDVASYLADEASIELDEIPLADFLTEMALQSGARKVHLIAHSMGNRAALRAMDRIVLEAEKRSGVRFGQIMLAAADVDARKFQQLCAAYPRLAERTTLYVSSRDMAVEVSRWLHDFPRAGLMPPVTIAPGIDTVDAANCDLTLLGHGYVAEARDLVSDLHALIHHSKPPQHRFGLRPATTPEGAPYWLIGA